MGEYTTGCFCVPAQTENPLEHGLDADPMRGKRVGFLCSEMAVFRRTGEAAGACGKASKENQSINTDINKDRANRTILAPSKSTTEAVHDFSVILF